MALSISGKEVLSFGSVLLKFGVNKYPKKVLATITAICIEILNTVSRCSKLKF